MSVLVFSHLFLMLLLSVWYINKCPVANSNMQYFKNEKSETYLAFLFDLYITISPSSWKTTAFLSLIVVLLFLSKKGIGPKAKQYSTKRQQESLQTIIKE